MHTRVISSSSRIPNYMKHSCKFGSTVFFIVQESEEESEEAAPPSSSPGPSFPMQDDQSTAAVEEGLADARLRFEDQQATSQPTTNIPQILSSVRNVQFPSFNGLM